MNFIKGLASFALAILVQQTAFSKDTLVKGYTRKDGTYVQPHYRSAPNNTRNDNYSTKGNENPYTGRKGTVDPDDYSYRPKPIKNNVNPYENSYNKYNNLDSDEKYDNSDDE